jgi:methylated-DNA-[protein]-cysteine S-methyltransferase
VIAYAAFASPLGRLVAAASREGLVQIVLPAEDPGRELARYGAVLVESPRHLAHVRRQLEEYFEGKRREFTLALDLSDARGFRLRALRGLTEIPYGEVVTYTELAKRAGNPSAARAAGHACATNPISIVVPCHRVLRRDGGLGGYPGGLEVKARLLAHEARFLRTA